MSVSYVVELIDKRDFDDLIKKRDRQFAAAEMPCSRVCLQFTMGRNFLHMLQT